MQSDDLTHEVTLAIQRVLEAPSEHSNVLPHEFDSVKILNDLFPNGESSFLL